MKASLWYLRSNNTMNHFPQSTITNILMLNFMTPQQLCAKTPHFIIIHKVGTWHFRFLHLTDRPVEPKCTCAKINMEPMNPGQPVKIHQTSHSNVTWSSSECVHWKPLKKSNGWCCYLYTSLWRSHRLAHSPAPLTAADLGHTWARTWLVWYWAGVRAPSSLFKLSFKVSTGTAHPLLFNSLPPQCW